MTRALVLGSGGRESALAWGLARSRVVTEVVAAPGNPGIGEIARVAAVDPNDPAAVVALARRLSCDLVVVGPEAPLVAGVADALRAAGIAVFGPTAAAARVEGSKAFAKQLMDRAGIATARWGAFETVDAAVGFMDSLGPPYVVKADGLAAGKGVVVTESRATAVDAVRASLERGRFGTAGATVVVEEFLDGEEASLIGVTDGSTVVAFEAAQDYKRAGDGDSGPNTGGMGSYSPVPSCPPSLASALVDDVLEPMVRTLAAAGAPFTGALYAGLALTSAGPRVLEFNARFGDPETQALVPRLGSDLGEICLACATGDLDGVKLEFAPEACVSVVLASRGYPGPYETGFEIHGVDAARALDRVEVFHAGTARRDGRLVTAGGRVLAVSALGATFAEARRRAYEAATKVTFEGARFRTDIALRAEEVG